jgi:hypothetical protein
MISMAIFSMESNWAKKGAASWQRPFRWPSGFAFGGLFVRIVPLYVLIPPLRQLVSRIGDNLAALLYTDTDLHGPEAPSWVTGFEAD